MAAFLFLEISYGQEDPVSEPGRNVLAVGYQIGGYTLVGIDYEVRSNTIYVVTRLWI